MSVIILCKLQRQNRVGLSSARTDSIADNAGAAAKIILFFFFVVAHPDVL